MADKASDSDKGLVKTLKSLDANMERLASFYQPQRYLWMGFFRGIVYGLGIMVSIALILPLLLAILSTIDWIPFFGDFISDIVQRMQEVQRI